MLLRSPLLVQSAVPSRAQLHRRPQQQAVCLYHLAMCGEVCADPRCSAAAVEVQSAAAGPSKRVRLAAPPEDEEQESLLVRKPSTSLSALLSTLTLARRLPGSKCRMILPRAPLWAMRLEG